MRTNIQDALEKVAGHDLETIISGLRIIEDGLHNNNSEDLLTVTDTLGSLLFIDSFDRPDLQPAVEAAVDILAEAGAKVIPYIIDSFEYMDIMANISFAKVLGKIGVPAIPYLVDFYRQSNSSYQKAYALYALGRIKDKAVLTILPDIMEAVDSEYLEVRDSAIRALCKTIEIITDKDISTVERDNVFNLLFKCIADLHSTIRAKALRALGKMQKHGLLTETQRTQLSAACCRITGQDENYQWDRAFIVRKEAQEVLDLLD